MLQELEQEKYHLRRRLEGVEEEYELKVSELQGDISSLRSLLQQTEVNTRAAEREKSLLITQLTEQNQRLTSQLKDVSWARHSNTQRPHDNISELQNRGISDSRASVDARPGAQQEDEHVGPRADPGDPQGGDHHHDREEDGPGAQNRGAVSDYRQLGLTGVLAGSVHGEGGSVLHPGRECGQDCDAREGGEGA